MYYIPIFLRIGKHAKVLRLGLQGKMDNSLDLTRGFTVTLCVFLAPLLVSLSWCLGPALTLRFDLFGTVNYSLSAWIISYIVMDGKSNWFEGMALIFV
jgi:Ca2+:H+ antiporter